MASRRLFRLLLPELPAKVNWVVLLGISVVVTTTLTMSIIISAPSFMSLLADLNEAVNVTVNEEGRKDVLDPLHQEEKNAFFFVAFLTMPGSFQNRALQRQTTVADINNVIPFNNQKLFEYRFFVGMPRDDSLKQDLEEEAEKFGDIVVLPQLELHENLPMKRFEAMMTSVNMTAYRVHIQLDDDCVVVLDRLAELFMQFFGEIRLHADGTYEPTFSHPNRTLLYGGGNLLMGGVGPISDQKIAYEQGYILLLSYDMVKIIEQYRNSLLTPEVITWAQLPVQRGHGRDDIAMKYWTVNAYKLAQKSGQEKSRLRTIVSSRGGRCTFFIADCFSRTKKHQHQRVTNGTVVPCPMLTPCTVAINHISVINGIEVFNMMKENARNTENRIARFNHFRR